LKFPGEPPGNDQKRNPEKIITTPIVSVLRGWDE
jgi:hypothetical protein